MVAGHQMGSAKRAAGVLASLAILASAACSSASTGGSGQVTGGNPDLLTRDQFEDMAGESAMQIVRRLRPSWLRARAQGTLTNPDPAEALVVLDGRPFGRIDSLSGLTESQIESMRFLDARDATTRYGTGYMGGVIEVTTRSRTPQND
ncbi:MAG: hypothetical protein WEB90_03620 [Gemmatimonadota bacterium]